MSAEGEFSNKRAAITLAETIDRVKKMPVKGFFNRIAHYQISNLLTGYVLVPVEEEEGYFGPQSELEDIPVYPQLKPPPGFLGFVPKLVRNHEGLLLEPFLHHFPEEWQEWLKQTERVNFTAFEDGSTVSLYDSHGKVKPDERVVLSGR